jgi:uncharacterized protein (DUF4415 family)
MNKKLTSARTPKADVPYDSTDRTATLSFWESATTHSGVAQYRVKRGRPPKAADDKKTQIALRAFADVLAGYRSRGDG